MMFYIDLDNIPKVNDPIAGESNLSLKVFQIPTKRKTSYGKTTGSKTKGGR